MKELWIGLYKGGKLWLFPVVVLVLAGKFVCRSSKKRDDQPPPFIYTIS